MNNAELKTNKAPFIIAALGIAGMVGMAHLSEQVDVREAFSNGAEMISANSVSGQNPQP